MRARGNGSRWFAVATAALVAIACLSAVGPLYRATFLAEIDINEGWNAYHIDALLRGRPLYPPLDALITNNYPPLSFAILAPLSWLSGDTLMTGRIISFVSLIAVAAGVFAILRLLAVRKAFAAIAALVYFATMCRLFDSYVGVNDPQLLGNALMTLGFAAFLRQRGKPSASYASPAALMVAAGFVKHSIVAMPLTALATLAMEDRRGAMRFALVGVAISAAGLALCWFLFGADFIGNVFGPRPYSLTRGLRAFEDLHRVPIAFFAWVTYAIFVRDGIRGRMLHILCAIALAESFFGRGADEVDRNAGFDLFIALHLVLGVALERMADFPMLPGFTAIRARALVVGLCAARLLFGESVDSFNVIYSPAQRAWYRAAEAATRQEVARVAARPGPLYCDSPLICYLAGKPFLVDPVNVPLRIAAGRLPKDAVEKRIAAGVMRVPAKRETMLRVW